MNLKRGLALVLTFLIVASALMISDGNRVAAEPSTICLSGGATVDGIVFPSPPIWVTGNYPITSFTSNVKLGIDGATQEYTIEGTGTTKIVQNGNIMTSNSVLDGVIKETGALVHATGLYEQDVSDLSHIPLTLEVVFDASLAGITNLHVESKFTAIGMYKYNSPGGSIWSLGSVGSEYTHVRSLGADQNLQLLTETGNFVQSISTNGFSSEISEFCFSSAPVAPVGPVGGTLMSVDKFAVASPYFVLLALMGALIIVVLARKKPRN